MVVLAVAVALAAGWWARGVTLDEATPDDDEGGGGEVVTAEVVPASVGRSMTLGVTMRQPSHTVAVNHLAGVVTAMGASDVDVGDVLYEVAGVPVVVVEGAVPFYRDLAHGTRGQDVYQLQGAVRELGYLDGTPDGVFGTGTAAAVRAWQRDLGIEVTGTVPLGQLVALDALPARVSLAEQVTTGAQLSGGEEAVRAPSGEQSFVLVLAASQEGLIPVGATVEIPYEGHQWQAVVASAATMNTEIGQLEMELTAPDGGPVCGSECDVLPADETLSILSTVVPVPPVEGLAVPAAAIHTRADGGTYVLLADGREQEVSVRGSGQGLAVIEGVEAGTQVQVGLPADSADEPRATDAGPTGRA